MIRSLGSLVAVVACCFALSGCAMCEHCLDYDYPAFGGCCGWHADDHCRAGSAFCGMHAHGGFDVPPEAIEYADPVPDAPSSVMTPPSPAEELPPTDLTPPTPPRLRPSGNEPLPPDETPEEEEPSLPDDLPPLDDEPTPDPLDQ
jgi:hypothetical protein